MWEAPPVGDSVIYYRHRRRLVPGQGADGKDFGKRPYFDTAKLASFSLFYG
jgi:hypothetical protein